MHNLRSKNRVVPLVFNSSLEEKMDGRAREEGADVGDGALLASKVEEGLEGKHLMVAEIVGKEKVLVPWDFEV